MESAIKIVDTIRASSLFRETFSFTQISDDEKNNLIFLFCAPTEVERIISTVAENKAIIFCSWIEPTEIEKLSTRYSKLHFFSLAGFSHPMTNIQKHSAIVLGLTNNENKVLSEYYKKEIQDIIIFAKNSKKLSCQGIYFTDIKTAIIFNDFLNALTVNLEGAYNMLQRYNCNISDFNEINKIILKELT